MQANAEEDMIAFKRHPLLKKVAKAERLRAII